MENRMIAVQMCLVYEGQPLVLDFSVPENASIGEVIALFCARFPVYQAALTAPKGGVAVFGKIRQLSEILRDGDRIEICGPLIATPMDARRRRAQREHKGGKM